jgi:hypothetical protein
MQTLDVFVANPVSKSFICTTHGILVFFSQVSFPSNVRIHLPATLELGIIYTPPIHRHSNFVYVLVPAVNPPSTTTHQSIRNPAEAGSFELLNSVHICALSI